jgi:hypothetical protein
MKVMKNHLKSLKQKKFSICPTLVRQKNHAAEIEKEIFPFFIKYDSIPRLSIRFRKNHSCSIDLEFFSGIEGIL